MHEDEGSPIDTARSRATGPVVVEGPGRRGAVWTASGGSDLERTRAALTFALVAFGMAVSGGPGLFLNAVVDWLALALIAVLVVQGPPSRVPLDAWLLIGLIVAIPLVQLVPLPAEWWTALPGRDLVVAVDAAAALPPTTHALSLDPDATRRSALSLLPGVAVYLSAARAGERERVALVAVAAGLAMVSAVMGAGQFAAGTGYLYDTAHAGWGTGLFNNRNQNADLLLAGIVLAAALGRTVLPRERRALAAGAMAVFALCCVSTGSRMGLAMLPAALAAAAAILFAGRGGGRAWPWLLAVAGAAAAAGAILLTPALHPVLDRFGGAVGDDPRFAYWRGVILAIRQYFPVGSGVGTFVPVYATVEDLDLVVPSYVNHAHNEYLEIALEAGVVGLLAVLAYLAMLARSGVLAFRARDWPLRAAGLAVVLVMLAHSAVEYPLRNFTLLIVFALGNALLTNIPAQTVPTARKKTSPFRPISG